MVPNQVVDPLNSPSSAALFNVRRISFTHAKRMGRSDTESDDVAQGVVLNLIQSWERLGLEELSAKPTFESYVRRATVRRFQQDARARTRRSQRELAYEGPGIPPVARRPGTLRHGAGGADDHDDYEAVLQDRHPLGGTLTSGHPLSSSGAVGVVGISAVATVVRHPPRRRQP